MPESAGDIEPFPDAYSLGIAEDPLLSFLEAGGNWEDLPESPPLAADAKAGG